MANHNSDTLFVCIMAHFSADEGPVSLFLYMEVLQSI